MPPPPLPCARRSRKQPKHGRPAPGKAAQTSRSMVHPPFWVQALPKLHLPHRRSHTCQEPHLPEPAALSTLRCQCRGNEGLQLT